MKHIYNIIGVTFACLMCSCSADNNLPENNPNTDGNYGTVEFALKGNANTRATTTTLSKEEAGEYWITIFKGPELSRAKTQLKTLDTRLYAGYGYTAQAENCDETIAVNANEGWGQIRFTGSTQPFAIKIGETTKVGITCSVANAGLEVVFDESIANNFTNSYKVTVSDGERSLVYDSETGGATIAGQTTNGKTAYFNVGEDGTYNISYTIEARGENLKFTRISDLTLTKATISRIRLSFVPNEFNLSINVDNENIFVEQGIEITDNDVTQDDGSANLDSNHDGFEDSDENVDINDYN